MQKLKILLLVTAITFSQCSLAVDPVPFSIEDLRENAKKKDPLGGSGVSIAESFLLLGIKNIIGRFVNLKTERQATIFEGEVKYTYEEVVDYLLVGAYYYIMFKPDLGSTANTSSATSKIVKEKIKFAVKQMILKAGVNNALSKVKLKEVKKGPEENTTPDNSALLRTKQVTEQSTKDSILNYIKPAAYSSVVPVASGALRALVS